MLQIETQSGFKGYGNGQLPGEYTFSTSMGTCPTGLTANWKHNQLGSSYTITGLNIIRWFTERATVMYGLDQVGRVVYYNSATGTWTNFHDPLSGSSGNGMITDQTGRLLIMRNQYLQMYNGSWSDNFKDLGSSVTDQKGMDTYQDWVIIPHGRYLAVLNVTDDSFQSQAFSLPSGCSALMVKANRTGILVGVNMGSRSFVFLWDAQAIRSKSDWIWYNQPLKSICTVGDEWIVTTAKEIWQTNGYTSKRLPDMPDFDQTNLNYTVPASGSLVSGNRLFLSHTDTSMSSARRSTGVHILNLDNQLWQFVPPVDNNLAQSNMGGLGLDSSGIIYSSNYSGTTSASYISSITTGIPTTANFITAPFGQSNNRKVAEGAKLELLYNPQQQTRPLMTVTVTAKIYTYQKALWQYAAGTISSPLNQVVVNSTSGAYNNADVGDEVTFLDGNNAGQIRHITAIANPGTTTETWTLNADVQDQTTAFMYIQPFKLINTFTLSAVDRFPVDGLYFDVKERYKGKKFLLKFVFSDMTAASFAIPSVSLIYNDLGLI